MASRNAGGFAFAEPCPHCRGRGLVVDDPCQRCHGSGRAASSTTVSARIPAGVRDGQRAVQQLGDAGLNLEGIRRVLELEEEVRQLRTRLKRYEHEERSTALVVWRPGRR